jgi:hypothetical protein
MFTIGTHFYVQCMISHIAAVGMQPKTMNM